MKKYLIILSSFVILLVITLLFLFKNIPSGKIWSEYTVLYTEISNSDELITSKIQEAGIKEFAGINNQKIPIKLTYNSVEHALFKLNLSNNKYHYLNNRNNYFFDHSGQYRLYYIPTIYDSEIKECIKMLKKENITVGIDNSYSYSYLLPVIVLILFIILIFSSKNKLFCFLPYIILFIFLINNPFFSCGVSVSILSFVIFIISNIWQRKGSFNILIKNKILYILTILSFITSFSAHYLCGILFLISILALISIIYLYLQINSFFKKRKEFVFSLIKPAKMISALGKNNKRVLLSIISCISAIIIYFFISSTSMINIKSSKINLPSNSNEKNDKLPTLEEYYKFNWQVFTQPYISLNDNNINYSENQVTYPRYKIENGIISEYYNTITYNEDFQNTLNAQIDELDYLSIEKIIKSEGNEFIGGYSNNNSYRVSTFSIFSMFICLFMLLFIYFSAIIRKGGKK